MAFKVGDVVYVVKRGRKLRYSSIFFDPTKARVSHVHGKGVYQVILLNEISFTDGGFVAVGTDIIVSSYMYIIRKSTRIEDAM